MEFYPHTRLAGECLQPLGHLSWRSAAQFRPSGLAAKTRAGSGAEAKPRGSASYHVERVANPIEDFEQRFSPRQRVVIVSLALTELCLKILAARDIQRRPADQIRGSKWLWRLALLVNTFGPLGYFRWGRLKTQR
jgi:hypothetical protein